jgi:hypothetical protein
MRFVDHGIDEIYIQKFRPDNLKGRNHLEGNTGGKIILK